MALTPMVTEVEVQLSTGGQLGVPESGCIPHALSTMDDIGTCNVTVL